MEEPLYTRILHTLVCDIAAGDLLPGDRLMENRIATRFGVSRAPARKALAALETLELMTHAAAPARGFIVAKDAPLRAAAMTPSRLDTFTTQTTPTWQRVYNALEDALTQRIAFGGWRLTETSIARQFDVSRTVAREALARLQARGLVVNEGKGWIAPELSHTRVRDLYGLRALLEPAALADVSALVPQQQIAQMIGDLQGAVDGGADGSLLDRLEADLHIALLGRCPNAALRKAMTQAQSLLLAHKFFYQHTAGIYPVEPFLNEHLAVLTALEKGEVPAACAALRDHLLRSSDRAVDRMTHLRDSFRDTPPDYLERLTTGP